MKFNLSGLAPIYSEAYFNKSPTLGFEVDIEGGEFVFMMFFSDEDEESKSRLFVYLKRTQVLLPPFKTYGSRRHGDFHIYINEAVEVLIRAELGILHGQGAEFQLEAFLNRLNAQIPEYSNATDKVNALRDAAPTVSRTYSIIDDADKIYLLGLKNLPDGSSPREKTLRKLYLYVEAEPETIDMFILQLKRQNKTLRWTSDPNLECAFLDVINR
ncbi:hypothetical protein MW344_003612 [Vibrio parahaemolyticus]|nr:hypothetical protein [Vibrio parahaemolyticus]ELZ7200650.1 hypothetical protein [Vibrio parahaemolyticus]HBC3530167.1 hypothetical protein [Vibrio parahaemolyticus]HBN6205674.1 hypothetical protein [Vibrio parahaemolyticus]